MSTEAKPKFDILKFFREERAELKKVAWPSRKTIINHTVIVITFILMACAFVFVLDIVFAGVTNSIAKNDFIKGFSEIFSIIF